MNNETHEVTREELKIQALLETISTLQGEKADLRVDLTVYVQEINRLQQLVTELEARVPQDESTSTTEAN